MKQFIASAILALATCPLNAEPVFYEASLTDNYGTPSRNEKVTLRISLLDAEGNLLYAETHQATTDARGHLFTEVGNGTSPEGTFDDASWEASRRMGVTITRADGSEISDIADLGYTPSAIHASTASTILSPLTADGSRYALAVDDNGNLSTRLESNSTIEIPEGYSRLLFHDEFDGEGLPDSRYWTFEEGYVRNGELQYYTPVRLDNCNIHDGVLHINLLNDRNYPDPVNGGFCEYTSASITTQDKVPFTYGRIDVRAKLPAIKGTWPAIWLMPNDSEYGPWPRSGEIDIMEQVGFDPDKVHFTAHSYLQHGDNNKQHHFMRLPTNYTEFHVYSLEWTENKLTWLVDGKRGFTVVKNSAIWTGWPYDKDFYLILNLAWGGGWGGQQGIDPGSLPQTYEVDYVRIFQ